MPATRPQEECPECPTDRESDGMCDACTRNALRGMPIRDVLLPSGHYCRPEHNCRECAAEGQSR